MRVWYKRFIPFFFLLLVLTSLVVAQATPFTEGLFIDTPDFDYHKEYSYFEINAQVYNISTGFLLDNNSVSCYGHLFNSSGERVASVSEAGTKDPYPNMFTFPLPDTSILHNGYYSFLIHCNTSDLGGYANDYFEVTATGTEEATSNDVEDELLLYFAFAIAIIFLLVSFWKEDHNLASISGMILVVLGGYIIVQGFSTLANNLSNALGIVLVVIGIYVLLRSNIDYLTGG